MEIDYKIIYPLLAAFFLGIWSIFHKIASKDTNNLLGATLISLIASFVGALFLLYLTLKGNKINIPSYKSLIALFFAGISALLIDFFTLKAYSVNLPISIVGPLIIGGSMLIAVLIGALFFGEKLSLVHYLGIILVIVGSSLLAIE
jgi:uncharacterized membrane protein